VGIITGAEFKIQQSQLEPGDILIGYTDGVTEALSPSETLYSREKFCALLELPASSAAELIERIQTDLFLHIDNAPQFDDITMIAVHRKPQSTA
jgi:sigma-B regulation protein RsbU (phosphoserine phosphatase)